MNQILTENIAEKLEIVSNEMTEERIDVRVSAAVRIVVKDSNEMIVEPAVVDLAEEKNEIPDFQNENHLGENAKKADT